ncbi:MAG: response regulator [Gammaproteobacteria bacterium]|nr:response regulator [Gammaproteobacteria bacterium]
MKILIVDDSRAMRKIIKWTIRQAEMHADEILEASCCEDALLIAEIKKPELIITDWNMPEMGGLVFLKALRDSRNMARFGFVVTQTSTNIRSLAKDVGADFIISNPSSSNTLKTQVSQSL